MREGNSASILCFMFTVVGIGTPVLAEWNTCIYGPHALAAVFETNNVQESSGVIASRTGPDIFWTHNDSGGSAQVWAFRLTAADKLAGTARNMGSVQLAGASNVDWEDIAAGPGSTLYVFDGGDNPPCDRTNKRIYRLAEPVIDPNGPPVSLVLTCDFLRFEYPDTANLSLPADSNDERFDAETLLVHPTNGDIYVVTKRTNNNTAAARVYKLPAASLTWNSPTIHVLQFVIDLSSKVPSTTTGGDIDAFGRRVLIRNYGSAYEFTSPDGQPFEQIFSQNPRIVSLSGEIQGEGLCYASNGGDIISTSEVQATGPQTFPVYVTPWQLANLRAVDMGANQATIRWDTATALGSTVDYGTSTSYGQSVSNPTPSAAHQIQLTILSPATTYFYRVSSGTLVYPQPAEANSVFFTTLPPLFPDFDDDEDVDQTDFGHFQVCLSGPGVRQVDPSCQRAKLDSDEDVDQADFVIFKRCYSGANKPAVANCAQ